MDTLCDKVRDPVSRLMEPCSIAVIGASANPGKRGYQIVQSLQRNGYPHPIFPVNPRGGAILGLAVVTDVLSLPDNVDLAVIARPAADVLDVLAACRRKGVAGAVVLANGFKESGPEGARLQEELKRFIAQGGIRVVGPNTSGMINFGCGADLVGLQQATRHGPVGAITQSGNMLLSLLADIEKHATPGLDVYVGLGNQIDVGFSELLTTMALRPTVKAIALHAEGFHDGRALLAAAAEVTRTHPVVLLRGGRSDAGRRTALSHTGSVSGSDRPTVGVMRQVGVTLVERSDELAIVAGALSSLPLPRTGAGVAVLSDGGGHATLAVDHLEAAGIRLASLSEHTRGALREQLGDTAVVGNPIDVASAIDASPQLFARCVQILHDDPDVGLVLIVGLLGGYHLRFDSAEKPAEDEACRAIAEWAHARRFPIVVHSCYEHRRPSPHAHLRDRGIPVTGSIEHAVACVRAVVERGAWLGSVAERTRGADFQRLQGPVRMQVDERSADAPSPGSMPEPTARRLLEAHGMETGPWSLARSADEARERVHAFGVACALKIVADGLSHKSDVGGVRLNVDADSAAGVYGDMTARIRDACPQARIEGVLVAPMIARGTELFLGVTLDADYGPLIAFGAGGITIEAVKDVAFRALPITPLDAREMILETRISKLLAGYRGMPSISVEELARLIVDVGSTALRVENLVDLEFNPIILNESGLHIADVRLISTS